MFQTGWVFWPIMQLINFRFLPTSLRAPYVACCAFVWTNFMCYLKSQKISGKDMISNEICNNSGCSISIREMIFFCVARLILRYKRKVRMFGKRRLYMNDSVEDGINIYITHAIIPKALFMCEHRRMSSKGTLCRFLTGGENKYFVSWISPI